MCGVLGFIANRANGFHQHEIKAVHDMLYCTALRGMDSTGVFYVTNSGDTQVHKEIGESGKFLKTKEWQATDKELFHSGQAIVGHCRHSTRGAKTDDNAHPFVVDNKIILVHNGTISGSHDHLAKTEVDSHAIAHVLAEEPDIAKAISKINGAFALIWYNTETKKLYAIRNKERPLWFGLLDDGSMMFASESSFIYTAAWRNGLKLKDEWPQMLGEHRLFSCDLDNWKNDYEWEDIDCGYKAPVQEPRQRPSNVMALAGPSSSVRHRYPGVVPTLAEVAEELGHAQWYGRRDWRTFAQCGQEVVVEAEDYSHIKDDIYYIYGKIASMDQNLNDFACGWEITCKTEEEVVQYVTREFFNAKIEFGIGRGYSLKATEPETALFKLHSVEVANFTTVETLEQ